MKKVFVDGSAGTTGLRIVERLDARQDIERICLPEALRKDPDARQDAIARADVAFLCLPDDAAREAARKWAGYFDGASFATLVKTPVRFVVGFADTTCAPHAVYSAYNVCPAADKAIWHGLDMSHSVYGDLYRRGDEWRRKKE